MDAVLESLAEEWEILGLGYRLHETSDLIANVNWVDNTYILAADFAQWEYMTRTLTIMLKRKSGWKRKPTSLEMSTNGVELPAQSIQLDCESQVLNYTVVERLEALGGVLCATVYWRIDWGKETSAYISISKHSGAKRQLV